MQIARLLKSPGRAEGPQRSFSLHLALTRSTPCKEVLRHGEDRLLYIENWCGNCSLPFIYMSLSWATWPEVAGASRGKFSALLCVCARLYGVPHRSKTPSFPFAACCPEGDKAESLASSVHNFASQEQVRIPPLPFLFPASKHLLQVRSWAGLQRCSSSNKLEFKVSSKLHNFQLIATLGDY